MRSSLLINPDHAGVQNQTREVAVELSHVSSLPYVGRDLVSFPFASSKDSTGHPTYYGVFWITT